MGQIILFSPIGGTDPISSKTAHDASMLHICRWYKPNQVYLFLSKEMIERHKKDDRYRYCIEKLGERLNHSFKVDCIEDTDLSEVQEYDYYYDVFKVHIDAITKNMVDGDILIVNIASGTPAMKSALLLLAVMSEKNIIPVQVTTPAKSINEHPGVEKDYDVELYWELNLDNEEGAINRCVEPQCPNLVTLLKKEILIKHILSYDYTAAMMLVNEIRDSVSDEAYALLQAAIARMQLDLPQVTRISNKYNFDLLPVKQSGHADIFEYALALQVKLYRQEYGDFVRAISPLIADLFRLILKEQCKIEIGNYCTFRKNVLMWDIEKLENDEKGRQIKTILDNEFTKMGGFKSSPVSASNIKPLLVEMLDNMKLIECIIKMRDIEAKIRNMAAHEIVAMTEEKMKSLFGSDITAKQIYDLIKQLVVAAKIKVNTSSWNSYDDMNLMIIEKLD